MKAEKEAEDRMAEQLLGWSSLIQSEEGVANLTTSRVSGAVRNFPGLIDILLDLPHFFGDLETENAERSLFDFFVRSHYFQMPYTFRVMFDLWLKGYYFECMLLFRSILEIFVQLRYFQVHPEQLEGHLKATKPVTFRAMFDSFADGYYTSHYGPLLSPISHGKTGHLAFRFGIFGDDPYRVRVGCEFDETLAAFVLNQLDALLFGYLNLFSSFFPNNTLSSDPRLHADWLDAKQWLERGMRQHEEGFPDSREWRTLMNQLVYQGQHHGGRV